MCIRDSHLFIHAQNDLSSIIRIIPLNEPASSVWSWAGQEILSKSVVRSSYEKRSNSMSDLGSDEKTLALWLADIKPTGLVFSSVDKAHDFLSRS